MAVTYTQTVRRGVNANGKLVRWVGTIAFSSSAYSSGLTVSSGSMGMPTTVEQLHVLYDNANTGNIYQWDAVNNKIRIFQVVSASTQEVSGSQTITVTVDATGW